MTADPAGHEALIEFLYRAPIGLLQTRPDGEITMINPMSAQLLMPLAPTGELGNLFDVLAAVAPGLRALADTHSAPGSVVCDGLRLTLQATAAGQPPQTLGLSITRLDHATLMCSLSDISHTVRDEQRRLADRLHQLGHTDTLTALPNRAAVRALIGQVLAAAPLATCHEPGAAGGAAGPLAVLFINADRFHQINLRHGSAAGDALLRQMAGRMAALLRAGDAVWRATQPAPPAPVAARLGGDEFVVLLQALRCVDDAQGIARRLVDALSRPYAVEGLVLHLGVSIGLRVGHATPAVDADSLMQEAGIAMREAKLAGGGRHALYDPAMKARATHRSMVESDLRLALERGELSVAYQPIVGLRRSAVLGVEALVRWRHPVRGLVSPADFIDIAEQTGLIGAVGRFVLDTACGQFMQWRRALGAGAPGSVSVNLSRAQLADAQLLCQVQQVLHAHGMPAAALQLEVTESLAAQDDGVRARLQALKALGLSLALDDFGTGYSSLSSLHQLPVDLVKIDRSFVGQLETSAHHRALVKATVDVARSLGMGTVAEGIETPGQARALQALQCQKGQGFWFGRPMPGPALASWLAAWPAARAGRFKPPVQGPAAAPAAASRCA